tara:strand:+ start:166 stop:396 length:231 start_codon:yes stop_codon:yes gene_type:complete
MSNYITLELNGGSCYRVNVPITEGESLALSCKGNGAFQNKMWDIICERIEKREGMTIQGYFNLISKTIEGKTSPLH